MAKLVWRVNLVPELEAGETAEVEVARLERDEHAGLADLGNRQHDSRRGWHLAAYFQIELLGGTVCRAPGHTGIGGK